MCTAIAIAEYAVHVHMYMQVHIATIESTPLYGIGLFAHNIIQYVAIYYLAT